MEEQLKDLGAYEMADEHALNVLGEKQFKREDSVRESIKIDFIEGFKACLKALNV